MEYSEGAAPEAPLSHEPASIQLSAMCYGAMSMIVLFALLIVSMVMGSVADAAFLLGSVDEAFDYTTSYTIDVVYEGRWFNWTVLGVPFVLGAALVWRDTDRHRLFHVLGTAALVCLLVWSIDATIGAD